MIFSVIFYPKSIDETYVDSFVLRTLSKMWCRESALKCMVHELQLNFSVPK